MSLVDILRLAVLSLAIVMMSMLLLAALAAALRRAGTAAAPAREPSAKGERLEPHIAVVLAAAVAEALGPRARIHRVHVHRGEADRWSRAGRMDVMVSHRVGPPR